MFHILIRQSAQKYTTKGPEPMAPGFSIFSALRQSTFSFLYRRRYFHTHPYIRRTASAGSHRQALSVAVRPVQHFPVRRDHSHHQPAWKYDRTHRPTAKYHPRTGMSAFHE